MTDSLGFAPNSPLLQADAARRTLWTDSIVFLAACYTAGAQIATPAVHYRVPIGECQGNFLGKVPLDRISSLRAFVYDYMLLQPESHVKGETWGRMDFPRWRI